MVIDMNIYEDCTCSSIFNATHMTKDFISKLTNYFDDEELIYDIRLIITELLVNCVQHGNKNDLSKKISLSAEIDDNKIIIKVKDEGEGVKQEITAKVEECKTCGRGLLIVKKLTDNLIFNKNEIVAELYL